MLKIESFKSIKKGARITLPEYSKVWKPVKEFPNLSAAKTLAVDTETKDPELLTAGPGWGRDVGHMIGASLATEDNAWYFPMRHEVQPELNMDPDKVLAFLKDVLSTPIPKVFANAQYDCGWLEQEGVTVGGKWLDVLSAEAIIDTQAYSYSLESVSDKYLGVGKTSSELYAWCARAYGGKPDGKQRANMYRTPPSLAGPYAESDARLPFDILGKQWKVLSSERLLDVFDIEMRLLPVLIAMRMRGVKISEEKALVARRGLNGRISILQQSLNEMAGFRVGVSSPNDLSRLFKKAGVEIQYTAKGNPSFQAVWLENEPHPAAQMVRDIRKLTKTISTFVDGSILSKHIDGTVYTSFHPLKSESGGAGTGRFSSSSPNLQFIPKRDKEIGPLMRSMFIPEPGFPSWLKMDYSSVEFRIFAHFIQSAILLEAYNKDPNMDFHKVVEDMVGGDLPRVAYKTLSFSRMFGGGVNTITIQMAKNFSIIDIRKMIQALGAPILSNPTKQLAILIINLYDSKFPMVKDALDKAMEMIELTGEMRTYLGRRVRFDLWEPVIGGRNKRPLPLQQARREYGNNLQRAKTYKGLNIYTQGSSADGMKIAMVNAYENGLFKEDKLGAPHLTIHDELDFSYHPDLRLYFTELQTIMEQSLKLDVPLIVEAEIGPNWGAVKNYDLVTGEFKI